MLNPALYPHPVQHVQVVHTHISTIFLTGAFAYKFKKPVNFGFLDFSTLERRKACCEAELAVNRHFAPALYVGVVALVRAGEDYHLLPAKSDLQGEVIDYAVQMHQFDPAGQLDNRLQAGRLTAADIDRLAEQVAAAHQAAEIAVVGTPFGLPAQVFAPAQQNVQQLRQHLQDAALLAQVQRLENWLQQGFPTLAGIFQQRREQGFIRACHGDLHLGNIAMIGGDVIFFDAIEFNEGLRWIDVASDLAFLLMDLTDRGCPQWAWQTLNHWLAATGDYAALAVLRFYLVYRAMVRAKVQALRWAQVQHDAAEQQLCLQRCAGYLQLAQFYIQAAPPALAITHGVSGSGKSYGAAQLAGALGLVHLRADVERKRLVGLPATARGDASLYTPAMTGRTYRRLAELATLALRHGYAVVVDATFLDGQQRQFFQQLARQQGAAYLVLAFQADPAQLEENVRRRQQLGTDASDADVAVLRQQLDCYRPLQDNEPYVTVAYGDGLPLDKIRPLLGFPQQ